MRFMVMHKMTPQLEKGLPPSAEELEGVNQLVSEAVRDGLLVAGEGLKPSAQRVHIRYEGGKRTITQGPFPDARELVGGFSLLRVRSREEAIGWCDKFAAAVGDVELFLGPVVEPWDMGAPKPDDVPLRFLAVHRMDPSADAGAPPSREVDAKVGALVREMTDAGVLESAAGLASTSKGARVHFAGGKRRVVDGPFTESKELIAGYAILDLPSKAAAIEWATRFGEVVRVNEVEVREVAG
jgi:hypothetical protein